jgi:RND superfamily putative drug exporter
VASVSPAEFNSAGSVAVFELTPETGAQAAETADLVSTIRDDTIPPAVAGTGLTALVSGSNAVFVDLDDRIGERLVWFILIVLVIAFVILAVVFRSLLIPAKAALFNVVTILATYGVFVAVFTHGWGRSILGVPIDVPMLSLLAPVVFAVLFGLSNDYEVYLVSRMREEHERDGDAVRAARVGHAAGSRVVVAAALVMIFVFASYVFQPGTVVKEFGFALAVAILLDAFITRMVMLPGAMTIGGEAMWWWPGRHRAPARGPTA